MKDFFGQPLEIGDEVAFERPHYRKIVMGKIVAFTPKQVRLLWFNNTCGAEDNFLTYPNTVIKKPHNLA